jgi:sialidase-1
MKRLLPRREFLRAGSFTVGVVALSQGRFVKAAPRATVQEIKVISYEPTLYHGWPTLTRTANGHLLLVYSGGREAHVCPFGRVELMRSYDQGQSWTYPQVLCDSPIDDRDAGVVETPKGTLLATTFTSLAYVPILERALKISPDAPGAWPQQRLQRWVGAHNRADEAGRQAVLDCWMIRSVDGGLTWSGRYRCPLNSPHGPFVLRNGRLLYAGKSLWAKEPRVGVCESTDDGQSWVWIADIPERPGDSRQHYHELYGVEAADGTLIVHIRNHNPQNDRETLQTESTDGGKTWSVPHPIGVWGLPSHLLRLSDGRLLMTYGYRRPPYGNQARLSEDHGRSWSEPITLSSDGVGTDLGYPSTVQLSDGSLLTVWYEVMGNSPYAVLRQARWTLA